MSVRPSLPTSGPTVCVPVAKGRASETVWHPAFGSLPCDGDTAPDWDVPLTSRCVGTRISA